MIPISLNLRNFMSYTDVHEPLRFDGVHVAVLSGDNGHGKSALLDAITWAVWGRARARSVDDLIHAGASEMEVEFEFELDEHQYRVIRKRQRRGKYGVSDLQFAVLADGGYKPLTERSVAETERLIERTLRMSYETFTNSSFMQQGKADSFTTNSPAERKRILAEILELGYYDDLEAQAKETFKAREAQLADERRLAQGWEQEMAHRPEYQADVDRFRAELAVLDERASQLEQAVTLVRERVAQLEAIQRQVDEIGARLQRFEVDRARLCSALTDRQAHLAQAQAIIARAEAVEQAFAELESVRQSLAEASERQAEFLPLDRAREATLRTLAAEQARLEGEVSQREQRIAELRQVSERAARLQIDLRRVEQEVATLAQIGSQHEQLQQLVGRCREEAAEKRTVNAQLKKEMLELKARIEALDKLATCPTCDRPMDPAHKQELRRTLTQQGRQRADVFRSREATYHALDAQIGRDEAQLRDLGFAECRRSSSTRPEGPRSCASRTSTRRRRTRITS